MCGGVTPISIFPGQGGRGLEGTGFLLSPSDRPFDRLGMSGQLRCGKFGSFDRLRMSDLRMQLGDFCWRVGPRFRGGGEWGWGRGICFGLCVGLSVGVRLKRRGRAAREPPLRHGLGESCTLRLQDSSGSAALGMTGGEGEEGRGGLDSWGGWSTMRGRV